MSQILYITILVDWSLSGIMTSKLVIRESELPRSAASSILISRMTSSSVIIPYIFVYANSQYERIAAPPNDDFDILHNERLSTFEGLCFCV